MPNRFNEHPPEPGLMTWSDVPRHYWIAFGITLVIGLAGGSIWIGWTLFKIHVLAW